MRRVVEGICSVFRSYWRQFLLLFILGFTSGLAGLGWPTAYAVVAYIIMLAFVECVIAYQTREVWLWPAVRFIEASWYGRTLDKEGTTEAERKEWKKKNKFFLGDK